MSRHRDTALIDYLYLVTWPLFTRRAAALGALLAGILVASCATPSELTPKTGPGTEYPCGVDGVSCPGHMCCGENETCGGAFPAVGCPAGMCCFIGSLDQDSVGAPRPHAQHPARY